jgi:hypothetical protein
MLLKIKNKFKKIVKTIDKFLTILAIFILKIRQKTLSPDK